MQFIQLSSEIYASVMAECGGGADTEQECDIMSIHDLPIDDAIRKRLDDSNKLSFGSFSSGQIYTH